MPPKKRSAASTDLPAELPFSPGQQSAELFASRSVFTVAFNKQAGVPPFATPALFEFSGCSLTPCLSCRKQHATNLALNGLASSPELAQWGNELHGRVRRWQTAFTATAIILAITVSALGYQTAVYHSGISQCARSVCTPDLILSWSCCIETTPVVFSNHAFES